MNRLIIPFLTISMMSTAAFAQEAAPAETASHINPVLSQDALWAGQVVIVIAGLFIAAALVGPVARANAPEEPPVAHSHDEPPGASHHHGHSGTKNPEPGHGDSGHGAHH
jgi:hypothetical protein